MSAITLCCHRSSSVSQCLSVDHKSASMKANVALCCTVHIYQYLLYDTKNQNYLFRPWQLNVWSACHPLQVQFQLATFVACHTCIYPVLLSASWPVIIQWINKAWKKNIPEILYGQANICIFLFFRLHQEQLSLWLSTEHMVGKLESVERWTNPLLVLVSL